MCIIKKSEAHYFNVYGTLAIYCIFPFAAQDPF